MKCFYHLDDDGHAAAAVVINHTRNMNPDDYIEIDYVTPIPIEKVNPGEEVWFVEKKKKKNTIHYIDELEMMGCKIYWIDHHESSLKLLEESPEYNRLNGIRANGESGALLTFRYLWPEKEIPYPLRLVSDYDCWKFECGDDSVYFHLGMQAMDNSAFSRVWQKLFFSPYDKECLNGILNTGKTIKNYVDSTNEYYAGHYGYESELDGIPCYVINNKQNSWIFGERYYTYPLYVVYVFDGSEYVHTLYSSHPDIDCAEIAGRYGGGGHKGAAGFSTKERLLERKILKDNLTSYHVQ